MTAEEFLKNRKNIHDKTISDGDRIMDFWEIAEIMQEYADHKQLIIADVVSTLFCDTCKTDVTYWADLGRHTCNCGRTTKAK